MGTKPSSSQDIVYFSWSTGCHSAPVCCAEQELRALGKFSLCVWGTLHFSFWLKWVIFAKSEKEEVLTLSDGVSQMSAEYKRGCESRTFSPLRHKIHSDGWQELFCFPRSYRLQGYSSQKQELPPDLLMVCYGAGFSHRNPMTSGWFSSYHSRLLHEEKDSKRFPANLL